MAPNTWSAEQLNNAKVIAAVGREMKMSSRDILIAIMTAMQESGLRNLRYGDRDSQGLFQQRPSQGWGTVEQVTNPLYASRKFFTVLQGVKNRNRLSLTQAAQAVQRSGFPDAYAKHEASARRLLNRIGESGGVAFPIRPPKMSLEDMGILDASAPAPTAERGVESPDAQGIETPEFAGAGSTLDPLNLPAKPQAPVYPVDPELMSGPHDFPALNGLVNGGARGAMIDAAMKLLGTPYSWGGGTATGPSYGTAQGANINGVDCSGLVYIALRAAGVDVGDMTAAQQMQLGSRKPIEKLQPGDLVAAPDGHHIGIYLGNGQMIHAPSTGDVVKIAPVNTGMVGIALSLGINPGPRQEATISSPTAADPSAALNALTEQPEAPSTVAPYSWSGL